MVDAFKTAAELPSEAPVHVHAIRTLAEPGTAGEPAPEGVHRDGYRVLGIFVIERCRIEGCDARLGIGPSCSDDARFFIVPSAVTELYKTKGAPPIFSGVLHSGDFVLVNDRVGGVFHYTSPSMFVTDSRFSRLWTHASRSSDCREAAARGIS